MEALMILRPLLAEQLERLEEVKLPVYASPKIDGIRCLIVNGKALTRSFKPIPNNHIRTYLEANAKSGFDGELITYSDFNHTNTDDFNTVQSKVMSEDGEPDFVYVLFDYVKDDPKKAFKDRLTDLREAVVSLKDTSVIKALENVYFTTLPEVAAYEAICVETGHEGVMLRDPKGKYKFGRSTLKEAILLKFKRFIDSEAIILDLGEQEKNVGTKEVNELGLTKRSHKKSDKILANTLGEFVVKDLKLKVEFTIGTGEGLTKELRQEIWDNKDKYIGKLVKYKYQGIGSQGKPRFPSFLGFRDERDMST